MKWEYTQATTFFPDGVALNIYPNVVLDQIEYNNLLAAGWKPICMAIDPSWHLRCRVILRRRKK